MLLKTRILLAEDDDTIVDLVYAALESVGFEVLRANNGAQGIEMIKIYTPDLLVLDVMMPVMDGIEAAGHIRKDELIAGVPILMLTALSSVDNKVEGLDAGADSYLPKPFDLREFKAQVKALLRSDKSGPGRNPLTDLPGPRMIADTVTQAVAKPDDSVVIYASIREFNQFVSRVKFDRASGLVGKLSKLFQDAMAKHFQFTSFLGHRGGGEFVIVLPEENAEPIISDVIAGFKDQHTELLGKHSPVPALTMHAAVVPLAGLDAGDVAGLEARVTQTMKAARADKDKGSHHLIWTPPPPDDE